MIILARHTGTLSELSIDSSLRSTVICLVSLVLLEAKFCCLVFLNWPGKKSFCVVFSMASLMAAISQSSPPPLMFSFFLVDLDVGFFVLCLPPVVLELDPKALTVERALEAVDSVGPFGVVFLEADLKMLSLPCLTGVFC